MPKRNKDVPIRLCLVCRTRPSIRAHLLPQSFVREIFHDAKDDEQHMVVHPGTGTKYRSGTGRFQRDILCAECDGILGGYEDVAFRLIKRLRCVRVGKKVGTQSFINAGTYPFRVADADDFIRFACGILWKYASIPLTDAAHIDIGGCKAMFEDICWRGAPIPDGVNVFVERDLLSFAAFKDPTEVYYYATPSTGICGHQTSQRMSWFSVGGFIIYVKLNQPGLSDYAPKKCWMRGRKACHFLVAMRSVETNSSIHESIGLTRDDLARLNRSIHAKYRGEQVAG